MSRTPSSSVTAAVAAAAPLFADLYRALRDRDRAAAEAAVAAFEARFGAALAPAVVAEMRRGVELCFAGDVGAMAAFVDDLDRRAAEQHAPVADGVTIATLHTAKGLEWDVVFLCGVVEGTLPITYALDSPSAVEEERRLLYVGMTRARDQLHLSWAQARNPGGRASRRPSRFLDGLRPETVADRTREQRGAKQRKAQPTVCRICRSPLSTVAERKVGRCTGCPASYDEALFERLRTWRSETAKAESVPAYVVFTDLTLQAIAEVQPTSADQLLRINGIGQTKREKYGDAVLGLLSRNAS